MKVKAYGHPVEELNLSIGGFLLRISGEPPGPRLHVDRNKCKFVVSHSANPDVNISAGWRDLNHEPAGTMIFDSGSIWQLHHLNGSHLFRFTSSAYGPDPYQLASFNRDFSSGHVYLHRTVFTADRPVDPISYPLDELLLVNFLAERRGAEIHACGMVDPGGRGHLFVGQSGAGKTTMARIWQNWSARITPLGMPFSGKE